MIFIAGNVPSLKNSKVATSKGVFMSKTVRKYLQALGIKNYSVSKKTVERYKTESRVNIFDLSILPMREALRHEDPPYLIGLHFVRGTKHKFDFINTAQIIFDLLVAHTVIQDDSMEYLIPYALQISGKYFSYDKEDPGVIIEF